MVLGDPLSGANSLLFYGGPADEIQQQKTALTTRPFRSILPTAHPYFQVSVQKDAVQEPAVSMGVKSGALQSHLSVSN
jgi:hypothetical protein